MKVIKGDLFVILNQLRLQLGQAGRGAICITTNGIVNKNNELVMGKGIALDCKQRYPEIPKILGGLVLSHGNLPFYLPLQGIISFPTKHDWRKPSNLSLIKSSAIKINEIKNTNGLDFIYSPWPGCSCGGFSVEQIRPVLEEVWNSDDFIIVEKD